MGRIAVVYYSQTCGNTERIAKDIQKATGADLFRIETVKPYTGTYNQIVDQGADEVKRGFCPAIKPVDADWSQYNAIVLGTPTWWYTMAPAMRTFLKQEDFSGRTVIPFQTHGGWPAHCLDDMADLLDGADVRDGFAVQFDDQGGPNLVTKPRAIQSWIEKIGS